MKFPRITTIMTMLYSPGYLCTPDKDLLQSSRLLSTWRNILIIVITTFLHLSVVANEAVNTATEDTLKDKLAFEKLNCTGTFKSN